MMNNIKMIIQTKLFKKLKKIGCKENDRDNEEIDEIKTNVR